MYVKTNSGFILGAAIASVVAVSGSVQAVPSDLGGFALTGGSGTYGTGQSAFNITTGAGASENNFFASNDTFSTLSPFTVSFQYQLSGTGVVSGATSPPSNLNGTMANFFLGSPNSSSPNLEFTLNPFANDVSNNYVSNSGGGGSGGLGNGGGTGSLGGTGGTTPPSGFTTITSTFVYTGSVVDFALSYNPGTTTLTETIGTSTGEHQTFTFNIDLATTLGDNINFGFEGKTGTTGYQQQISKLNYVNAVPEPGIASLFLAAGAGLLLLPIRRNRLKAAN